MVGPKRLVTWVSVGGLLTTVLFQAPPGCRRIECHWNVQGAVLLVCPFELVF